MSLKEYKAKRDLSKTKEPAGFKKNSSSSLNFCIQKHAARHLHYDFRLEYQDVLLSWAVPKGPSMNPQDKRLAIQVEDHPLDYQYFEGIIPKGNYGAGTVKIWDHGTYTMPETADSKEIEKKLSDGLKKGHFAVVLHGNNLKGEFIFQKLKRDENDHSWLLIKKSDPFSSESAEEMETISEKIKGKKNSHQKMPEFIAPMLATLVDEPFDSEDWLFEIKWDGFRTLAFINQDKVELKSRNNLSFNHKFPLVVNALKKCEHSLIFDGEIVIVDEKGRSNFQLMQNYKIGEGSLCYYVFDVLYKDGVDLRDRPLIERKELLKNCLAELDSPLICFSDHLIGKGKIFFKAAEEQNLEGIIGKKIDSEYQSRRSRDWIKIKTALRQEMVVCGFTEPRGSRKKFGALIAGIYDEKNELHYTGHVGGGFSERLLNEIYNQLIPLIQKKSPFKVPPKVNMPVIWVKPKLVAEVSFAEWTKDSLMRQPVFKGLRMDKDPKTVKKEIPQQAPKESTETGEIKKIKDLVLTNLEKVYWPKEKYTKGDLIAYYEKVAPFILPYLKDRPMMLHRYPEGIEGMDFYQKDLNFNPPSWIKTYPIQHEEKIINYLIINDLKSLLYAVNLGSIDLHPFMSRTTHLDHPDYCVIDLDPHEISSDKLVEAALVVHDILNQLKLTHCCKTSGGKGLHVVIPLQAKYDFDESKQFAELLCYLVHQELPKTTSLERLPEKRPKRIYLDFLQNRSRQSIAAPYSVRPKKHATVSTPLDWTEVNKELNVSEFTIQSVPKRLEKIGDLFKPVLGKGINMKAALAAITKFSD